MVGVPIGVPSIPKYHAVQLTSKYYIEFQQLDCEVRFDNSGKKELF